MEVVCKLDIGSLSQMVYVLTGSTQILKHFGKASMEELPDMLIAACSEYDINKIHLYGNDLYLVGIIYEINQKKMLNNDYKNIIIEVN